MYQLGIVDDRVRAQIAQHEEAARQYISKGQNEEATDEWNYLLGSLLSSSSGFSSLYNFLYAQGEPEANVDEFVTRREVC